MWRWRRTASTIWVRTATYSLAGTRFFFYEFATRRTARVALLAKSPGAYIRALALSPDERALIYVQLDWSGSDLMLLEHFR